MKLYILLQLIFVTSFVNASASNAARVITPRTTETVEITNFSVNGITNSNGDGYFSKWNYFGKVPLCLSNEYNNMHYSDTNIDLYHGKSYSPYTISVNNDAYRIIGYDIYFRNSDTSKNTTLIPSKGGPSVTCSGDEEAVLKVSGLDNYKSTTFEVSTTDDANVAARISKIVAYLSYDDTAVSEQDHILFDTKTSTYPYRIPALAITKSGDILAFSDYRPCGKDIGWGDVDIHLRISEDNGLTWGAENKILDGTGSGYTAGYGDAAVIADRESDRVRLVCVTGDTKFAESGILFEDWFKYKRMRIATTISEDNGRTWSKPVDITDMMYSIVDVKGQFFTSGRIVQSQQIKVGSYYRIYAVLCTHSNLIYDASKNINYVCYSDDFGETWKKLGDVAINGGDEAKCEELPNGNLMVSTRMAGGRKFNIFTYSDLAAASGSWGSPVVENSKFGDVSSCNGEILIVDAHRTADNEPVKLLLHSLSRNVNGVDRSYVSIYHKELDAYATPSDLATGWSDPYVISEKTSAYSTMLPTHDDKIAFLFEDEAVGDGYQMTYYNLDLREITGDKYYLGKHIELGINDVLAIDNDEHIVNLEINADPEHSGQIFAQNGEADVEEVTLNYSVEPGVWNFISFPADANIDQISNLNELGFQYNATGEKSYYLKEYSEANRASERNDGWSLMAEPVVTKGKGYLFCIADNSGNLDNLPIEVRFRFRSEDLSSYVNNMDANMTSLLSYSETGEEHNRGWNLLGNPYFSNMNPTATNSFEFTNLAPFIYQYSPEKDTYITFMSGSNEVMSISPFSAFFVQAIGTNPSVLFHNLHNENNTTTEDPGLQIDRRLIRLSLFADGEEQYSDRTDILMSPDGSNNFILGEDAMKMWGGMNGTSNEMATIADGKSCAVNHLTDKEDHEVPLMLNLRNSGIYTLKLMPEIVLADDEMILLRDNVQGVEFDLRADVDGYSFKVENVEEAKNRFTVKILRNTTSGIVDNWANNCRIRTDRNVVYVENLPTGCRITLFDISGKVIADECPGASFWNASFESGIYLIRIMDEERTTTQKLLLGR